MAMTSRDDSRPPSPSGLPPIPASPTYSYASTTLPVPSSFNLPLPPAPRPPHAVLTNSDLESSQTAYTDLLSTAKSYRLALASLSTAASSFGSALEACARLKEARSEALSPPGGSMSNSFTAKGSCTADSLLAASGVHQLIGNHQQILSETVYRSFEVPLLHEMDNWRRRMEEEEVSYQKEAKSMSKEIRKLEKEGLRLHKQRKRDVHVFREHLVTLTRKLDGLTNLHGGHSRGLLRDCQDTSHRIVECGAGLVRAEVDIFEALARKGWSGGGLEDLLEKGRDLFANDADAVDGHSGNHGSKIFSILPQNRSILAVEGGSDGVPRGHNRNDSVLTDGITYQSLAGAVSTARDADVVSIFSERGREAMNTSGILNRSRGVRPFSPPPMERVRDPLEDINIPAKARHENSGKDWTSGEQRDREEQRSSEESAALQMDGKERVAEDRNSTNVVLLPVDEDTAMVDDEGGGGSDETFFSAPTDNKHNRRERERRWSITDDGVVSE